MAGSLLDQLKELVTPEIVARVGGALGESEENVTKGFRAAIPALLGGLISRVGEAQGAERILSLVNDTDNDGSVLHAPDTLLSDTVAGTPLHGLGQTLLGGLFSGKTDDVAESVAIESGLQKSSVTKILGFLSSLLLSVLGKNLGPGAAPASLVSLIASQSRTAQAAASSVVGGIGNLTVGAITVVPPVVVTPNVEPLSTPVEVVVTEPQVIETPIAEASIVEAPVVETPVEVVDIEVVPPVTFSIPTEPEAIPEIQLPREPEPIASIEETESVAIDPVTFEPVGETPTISLEPPVEEGPVGEVPSAEIPSAEVPSVEVPTAEIPAVEISPIEVPSVDIVEEAPIVPEIATFLESNPTTEVLPDSVPVVLDTAVEVSISDDIPPFPDAEEVAEVFPEAVVEANETPVSVEEPVDFVTEAAKPAVEAPEHIKADDLPRTEHVITDSNVMANPELGGVTPKWFFPVLAIVLLAGAAAFFLLNGKAPAPAATPGASTPAVGATPEASSSEPASEDTLPEATAEIKLPDGKALKGVPDGTEEKLVAFAQDAAKTVDENTWFNFDRLSFAVGKASLKPESRPQIENIVAVLNAFPGMTIKIGGYTDNTGDANANLALSSSRATAVMKAITGRGIAPERVEAEGYGDQHPECAANDTEDCRKKNRRVAILVTKK